VFITPIEGFSIRMLIFLQLDIHTCIYMYVMGWWLGKEKAIYADIFRVTSTTVRSNGKGATV